jgi:hypothetical protein
MIILIKKREMLVPGRPNGRHVRRTPVPVPCFPCLHLVCPRGAHTARTTRVARPTKNTQRPLDAHASYAFQCPCRQGPLVPRMLSNALAAAAGGCDRWSHCNVQHQVYFYNIKMKYLQHMSKTVETLATYV